MDVSAQLAQREAELAVINSVQQGLLASLGLDEIYELVGDRLRDLFDAQVTGIYTFDLDEGVEYFQYLFEDGGRLYPTPRPLNKLRQWIIDHKTILHITKDADDKVYEITGERHEPVPGTRLPQSLVFVPLMVKDEVRGCVSLQNLDRENAFSESDVRLLSTLANTMSVALENARLFSESTRLLAETEQRNAELAVINSVQQGLVAQMDLQSIYDLVGDQIRDLFEAQVVAIATLDPDQGMEYFKYTFEDGKRHYPNPRSLDKIRLRLIKTRRMILINENAAEAFTTITGEAPVALPGTLFPKSMIFVPLVIGEMVRGYVSLQNLDREQAFSDSDVRLLNTLANSMTVALENARLFNETQQRNAELAVINSVQDGLVAEMDMQGIYELVGERIRKLFDSQVTAIVTFDLPKALEHFNYLYEDGDRLYPRDRPYDKVRHKIINERSPLLFNENAAEELSTINGEPHKPVPGTRVAKSALYVPMVASDSVRGYVTLQNLDRENAFSESDVRLLTMLTNSMSVALENARLFSETTRLLTETEQRNAELAVINSVQDGLVREMDMQAIYNLVGERICDVLKTQTMIIRTFDHKSGMEYWQYAVEKGKKIEVSPRPLIWANKILVDTKKYLLINQDYELTAIRMQGTAVTKGLPPKSAIFVPMMVGDVVVGSVSLQNVEKENAFSESDVRLLTTLTNSMSVALENARLFNETTQRAAEMDTVNRISRALVSQLELDALMNMVGEQMRETFKADIVYLAMYDADSGMISFPYEFGDKNEPRKFGNGFTEKIITSKEPLLINKDLSEVRESLKSKRIGRETSSFMGVPILFGDRAVGVISVQSVEEENRFDENDQRLLATIAANVSVALQNAEAYRKLSSAVLDLKAAQEQLVQQEKLASLGQLTAGIAHEIKNPLNFVNNFASVSLELVAELKQDVDSFQLSVFGEDSPLKTENGKLKTRIDESLADIGMNLKKIHEHGTRADKIVKGMLMHSRGTSGESQRIQLNSMVDEYVNLAYHGMRATDPSFSVDIRTEMDPKVGEVTVVPQDLSRAILNIVNNACYAVNEKKRTVGFEKGVKPTVTVKTVRQKDGVKIVIHDNGTGIPESVRKKIFEPFYTTKPTGEGTGLGLSMTYDIIVHTLGGKLDVNTEPGQFTEFVIHLPAK
jgi:GAF domain-containing protein